MTGRADHDDLEPRGRRPTARSLAGVEPAGLFRSDDGGATWQHVEGLTNHPTRPDWRPGAGGLILHTIVPHPTDPDRMWVGISAVGVFETRDRGTTVGAAQRRVSAPSFNPGSVPETGQCVHKFAMAAGEPETLYQQNHCGQYRSDDGGATWTECPTTACRAEFGFPMVTHPRDPDTFWVIPLKRARPGPLPPRWEARRLANPRSRGDMGRADAGLPTNDAFLSVLREAMARDTLEPAGVSFGTEDRPAVAQRRRGPSWQMVTDNLPEIWAARRSSGLTRGDRPAAAIAAGAVPRRRAAARRCRRPSTPADRARRERSRHARSAGRRGPRLRPHINVFVDGDPADLATSVDAPTVHVIPAVSGGSGRGSEVGVDRAICAGAERVGIIRPCQSTDLIDRRAAEKRP